MNVINVIKTRLINEKAAQILHLPTEIDNNGYYGARMDNIIKSSTLSVAEVSNYMRIDNRTMGYIKSQKEIRHRKIRFFEALAFIVVTNLSLADGLDFLNICNYSLCFSSTRDRLIFDVLSHPHASMDELNVRLDCLIILENNNYFNQNNFDYLPLFEKLARTYSD